MKTTVQTPVFLDHLPDISTVTGRKPEVYRLSRNKALADLLLDESTVWQQRANCPACGAEGNASRPFSQAFCRSGAVPTATVSMLPKFRNSGN